MPQVLVATPLKYAAVSKPYDFADGISIRDVSPILWENSIVKGFISEKERQELSNAPYWLCASNQYDNVSGDVGEELYDKARHASWALQLLCPSGAKHIFLKLQKTDKGYDNIGSQHPKLLCSTLLGRIIGLEKHGLEQYFDAIYLGVHRSFTEKVVRLQNPVLLLEHGMQIGNVNLATLMFVMGLDMLFMAGEIGTFVKRLGGFLGLDAYVFPPDDEMNRQPNTVVRDVLNDLYEFRNIIAHGQEIPEDPYRKKKDLFSTNRQQINWMNYYYAELLLDSGLFMLTTALRRIFTEGLFDEVKDPSTWRAKMRLYEHRYKEAGGLAPVKQRGR